MCGGCIKSGWVKRIEQGVDVAMHGACPLERRARNVLNINFNHVCDVFAVNDFSKPWFKINVRIVMEQAADPGDYTALSTALKWDISETGGCVHLRAFRHQPQPLIIQQDLQQMKLFLFWSKALKVFH